MNSTIKMLVTFVTGLGVGVLGTYLVVNTRNQKLLDETMKSAKEFVRIREEHQDKLCNECEFKRKYETQESSLQDIMNEAVKAMIETDYTSYYDNSEDESTREQLEKLSDVIRDDDFDKHFAERESPQDDTPDDSEEAIYVIPEETFFEDPDYAKISLTYYTADKTLANMQDDIVTDVDKFVGDCLMIFDHSEQDVVYIRNEKLEIDFEVTRDSRSYKEVAAGM